MNGNPMNTEYDNQEVNTNMLNWKSKAVGRIAVRQIQDASDEDYKKIYAQALKMFGPEAAAKIQEIRDGKVK